MNTILRRTPAPIWYDFFESFSSLYFEKKNEVPKVSVFKNIFDIFMFSNINIYYLEPSNANSYTCLS